MIAYRLSFRDLRERGVVKNRSTLRNWILRRGFPQGQMTGPNTRTWTAEEIQEYLDSRPTEPKKALPAKRPRGRPRKVRAQESANT
jgi:predicted DNA-binding transcriptional regulator AlpA